MALAQILTPNEIFGIGGSNFLVNRTCHLLKFSLEVQNEQIVYWVKRLKTGLARVGLTHTHSLSTVYKINNTLNGLKINYKAGS